MTAYRIGDRVRVDGDEGVIVGINGWDVATVKVDDATTLHTHVDVLEPVTSPAYTDDHVTSLVAIAQAVVQDIEANRCDYATSGTVYRLLREALAPFEEDPDAELIEQLGERISAGMDQPFDKRARDILAFVREHDRKGGEA